MGRKHPSSKLNSIRRHLSTKLNSIRRHPSTKLNSRRRHPSTKLNSRRRRVTHCNSAHVVYSEVITITSEWLNQKKEEQNTRKLLQQHYDNKYKERYKTRLSEKPT